MAGERTERPTPKRREEARKRGQIARRPELAAAIAFLAALGALRAVGSDLGERAATLIVNSARMAEAAATSNFSI
ncbi:EscU/YscU/HrcU family type III secretion system export apparatus switch protein, partial [Escherichia coli]|nr:EscU/YscU/HrcU family type III secretion system export apparatus switch protein [Escherichia coli]